MVRHRTGLYTTSKRLTKEQVNDLDFMSNFLSQEPIFFDKPKAGYMAITQGFYINELIRRVDPKGRNIEQFITDEITKPLGGEIYFKVSKEFYESERFSIMHYPPMIYSLIHLFIAKVMNPLYKLLGLSQNEKANRFLIAVNGMNSPILEKCKLVFDKDYAVELGNHFDAHSFISTAANGKSNANTLARIAQMVLNKGELDGVRIISEETLKIAAEMHPEEFDEVFRIPFQRTTGGFQHLNLFYESPGATHFDAIGGAGHGGSMIIWENKRKIAIGYSTNAFGFPQELKADGRSYNLLKMLVDIIDAKQ